MNLNKLKMALSISTLALGIAGRQTDSQMASYNLSTAADLFEIHRRVVFYNGISGEYVLTLERITQPGYTEASKYRTKYRYYRLSKRSC